MNERNGDYMDDLQALISDQIEKYHEDKIKRDQGESSDTRPRPGMKPVIKAKMPQALLQQYFTFN